MQKQQDELMKRFIGKLNRPKREKSEQSNQQKTLPQVCARQVAPDPLFEQHLLWLENLNAEVRSRF